MDEFLSLGNSGLATPALVLGGNVFGWTLDRDKSFAILDAFVGGGGRMIDTADIYPLWRDGNRPGVSETIIGEWMSSRGNRDQLLIATKVGLDVGLGGDTIERGADASLRRLGTDRIDLFYTHADDPSQPIVRIMGALDRLVRAGKIRAIGASAISRERLEQAMSVSSAFGLAAYSVLQARYNLLDRDHFESGLAATAQRHRLGVLTYFSLANGYLTGKYRRPSDLEGSVRRRSVEAKMTGQGLLVLATLDSIAAELKATPAQVALAWIAAQPTITAPIASATSVAQVRELLGLLSLALTSEQCARLDQASRRAD